MKPGPGGPGDTGAADHGWARRRVRQVESFAGGTKAGGPEGLFRIPDDLQVAACECPERGGWIHQSKYKGEGHEHEFLQLSMSSAVERRDRGRCRGVRRR